jgi:hypothetical protein
MEVLQEEILKLDVVINSFSIDRIDEKVEKNTPVTFRINVKFDETNRKIEETTVEYGITINTEPNVAHFGIEGKTIVKGKIEEIDRIFSTSPDNQVPKLLNMIYERIYSSIYMASSMINIPCPSPELLKTTKIDDIPSPGKIVNNVVEDTVPESPETNVVEDTVPESPETNVVEDTVPESPEMLLRTLFQSRQ